jgi:orotate phosphoribosyltransferase
MLLSASDAPRVAQALVGLGAVRIASHQPFIYTSGWASPVYVDAQVLMSDVALRSEIMDIAARCMRPLIAARGINAIVGTESSGIAFAAWLAERLELPMLYLRKRPVGWDITAQLEGRLPADAKVLLVDDVTTDGRSKAGTVAALRRAGPVVEDVLVLLDYALYAPRQARWPITPCPCMLWRPGISCTKRCWRADSSVPSKRPRWRTSRPRLWTGPSDTEVAEHDGLQHHDGYQRTGASPAL